MAIIMHLSYDAQNSKLFSKNLTEFLCKNVDFYACLHIVYKVWLERVREWVINNQRH